MTRAASGDASAVEELVRTTTPAVYSLALRLVGNEHDARDVVQETYLRALRALPAFRFESRVETWLYRICANCASTHLKSRRRRAVEQLDADYPLADPRDGTNPEDAATARDERDALVAHLFALPSALRAVIVLRDIYDLDHQAIATELGISRAASKVRLHRARRALREQLYPSAPEEVRGAQL